MTVVFVSFTTILDKSYAQRAQVTYHIIEISSGIDFKHHVRKRNAAPNTRSSIF